MGMLAVGAGSADGLSSYLLQMLRESQLADEQKKTAESSRHNQAEEALAGRTIDENAKYRGVQQQIAQTNASRLELDRNNQEANRTRDDMRTALDDLLPGARIAPATHDKAIKSGAALPERFKNVVDYDTDFTGPLPSEAGKTLNDGEGVGGVEPGRGDVGHYTIEGQPKNQGTSGVIEQKTYVLDGKPVDGFLNNRTGRITSTSGEDITAKVQHYTAPDRTLIQTGDGYDTRAHATATLAGGGAVPLPETSSTRTMAEGASMIRPHIAELDSMAQELQKRGLFGPVMSKVRGLAEKFGTSNNPDDDARVAQAIGDAITNDPELNQDRLVGKFATTLGLMASGAGRVHGGARGGGSPQMMQYMKSLLSANGSLSMFQGRLDGLDSYMKTYEAGPGKASSAAPAPAATDIYDEYLKRHQP